MKNCYMTAMGLVSITALLISCAEIPAPQANTTPPKPTPTAAATTPAATTPAATHTETEPQTDTEIPTSLPMPDTNLTSPAAKAAEVAELAKLAALGRAAWIKGSCSNCHGADGSGNKLGPDLTDDTWFIADSSAQSIKTVLLNGVSKSQMNGRKWFAPMPPATKKITDDKDIDALVIYVRNLSAASNEQQEQHEQ